MDHRPGGVRQRRIFDALRLGPGVHTNTNAHLYPQVATRLDFASTQPTRQRLDELVAAGHYRSNNAAVVDAINRLWEKLRQEVLDARP
jgi:hypothetical protein